MIVEFGDEFHAHSLLLLPKAYTPAKLMGNQGWVNWVGDRQGKTKTEGNKGAETIIFNVKRGKDFFIFR